MTPASRLALLLLLGVAALVSASPITPPTLASIAAAAPSATARPASRADAAARAAAMRAVDDIADGNTRLHQLQVLGTTRSYRVAPPAVASEFLASADGRSALAAANKTAAAAPTLNNITREPLGTQADRGIRAFHLDAWADPRGGAYSRGWAAPTLAGGDGTRDVDAPSLKQKGWKVMADPDFDALSTCVTLTSCLRSLKAWSDANPKASPLFVFVEPRDDPLFKPTDTVRGNATFSSLLAAMTLADGPKGLAVPPPVDTAALASLNSEILSVFPPTSQLMTPARLAAQAGAPAGAASLTRYIPGVKGTGWPALRDARGKVFIVLVGAKAQAFSAAATAGGSPPAAFVATPAGDAPRDGALFVDAATGPLSMLAAGGAPVAATAVAAAKAATTITAAAKRGALVRAAADWGGLEPASGATARRDAVLGAGAQFVFTDTPWSGRPVGPADYTSPLPRRAADGSGDRAVAARCNPVTSPNRDSINVEAHGCGSGPEDASEADTIIVGRAAAVTPAPAAKKGKPVPPPAAAAVAAAPAVAASAGAPSASVAPAPAPAGLRPGPRGIVPASPAPRRPNAAETGDLPPGMEDDGGDGADAEVAVNSAAEPQAAVDDDDDDDAPSPLVPPLARARARS